MHPEVKALAFTCLVRPHYLEYGLCLSFLGSITAIPIVPYPTIRRSARRGARIYRRTTSVSQLLSDLNWSPLSSRCKSPVLSSFCPISLDYLRRPTIPTTSADSLTLPARVDSYKYSFFRWTVIDWNTLPSRPTTRSLSSVNSFRNSAPNGVHQTPFLLETSAMTHWQQRVRTHCRSTTEELKAKLPLHAAGHFR